MQEKKLGLPSIVATGVGLIIATSCLLSIGQGASTIGLPFIITMAIACAFNILTAFSICELNALMPNLTGGMHSIHWHVSDRLCPLSLLWAVI